MKSIQTLMSLVLYTFLILLVTPLEIQANTTNSCSTGQSTQQLENKSVVIDWSCGCGRPQGDKWVDVGGGCFHKQGCAKGEFTNSAGAKVAFACGCSDVNVSGWQAMGDGCFHKQVTNPTTNPNPTPNPNSSETTIQTAKIYPTGDVYKDVKWAGVFDPRNSNLIDFKIVNRGDATRTQNAGKCLAANDSITFLLSSSGAGKEVLENLKIRENDKVAMKIIIPPGVGKVEFVSNTADWGKIVVGAAGPGSYPRPEHIQANGRFGLIYSDVATSARSEVTSAIVGPNVNLNETYATAWFFNQPTGGEEHVSLVSVVYHITNYVAYNQWVYRTTGSFWPGCVSTNTNTTSSFFGAHKGSIPMPVNEDRAFKSQEKYKNLKTNTQVSSLIFSGTSHEYYKRTLTFKCDEWTSQTSSTSSCLPHSFYQTSRGDKQIRILIPPGVTANLNIASLALQNTEMLVGVHSRPDVPFSGVKQLSMDPGVEFMEGYTALRQDLNIQLQLVKDPKVIVPGFAQPLSVNLKPRFVYVSFKNRQEIDYPISQFNLTFITVDRQLLNDWLNSCTSADLNECVPAE